MASQPISTHVYPAGMLNTLSRKEVTRLHGASQGDLNALLRRCALAVLNSGADGDDAEALMARYKDFAIDVTQVNRGIRMDLTNAPGSAFVDGEIIRGIRELLSAVVRDIAYFDSEISGNTSYDLDRGEGITSAVFEMLRNANMLVPQVEPSIAVCWGGHSISRDEYDYTKRVGYEIGLRKMNICTGCGPGAMKGPMKGATIAHAKQRMSPGRYIGITEPGIIAAESPNPIVNELAIMPDIEKRLEAFVRLGHGIIVFPGGVGTAEEILYLMGILLHPANKDIPFPLVFTGPRKSAEYFNQIDAFLKLTLGERVSELYEIIIDDAEQVAQRMGAGMQLVTEYREQSRDAYYFNWALNIDQSLQMPFQPSHENMKDLALHRDQPAYELAAALRRAFSGIVAGNVKADGIAAIREHGPFEINGEPELMQSLDALLRAFVAQHRMKLPGAHEYNPCYRVKTGG
nr:putative LOG family protein [uncultured bacterium]